MFALNSNKNSLKLFHRLSNSELEIYYRNPTTEERVDYRMEKIQRINDEIKFNIPETRVKFGEKIITGFREGDFGFYEEGNVKEISSDPSSENYREDWKTILKENASDVLETLAGAVFDDSIDISPPPPDEKIDKKKIKQDLTAISEGLCTPEKEEKCMIESGGNRFACKKCKHNYKIHPYTIKLLTAISLIDGGYQLGNNSLTIWEWQDMGIIKQWQQETQQPLK